MKTLFQIAAAPLIAVIVAALFLSTEKQNSFGSAISLCSVTETTVTIGNQLSTTLLVAGSYEWVTVQQPSSATNTVSLSLGGTAVSGKGQMLTPATSTSPVPLQSFGFAVDRPYKGAITAITDTGSTTVNVISCR